MTKTASMAALLHVALQDLRAGKALLVERLPALETAATAAGLRDAIAAMRRRAGSAIARLDPLHAAGGPDNLWMRGIIDDADRDARSHLPGPILDIALVGALRKACAAEIVSFDTAIALSSGEAPEAAAILAGLQADTIADDAALRQYLP